MLQVVPIIFPVFFIVLCGYVYARFEQPDMHVINKMILELLVPALVFSVMSSKEFEIAIYADLAISASVIILVSGLAAFITATLFSYNWRTLVPPMMFKNWGNLGIPLIVFTFGEQALNAAVILFLVGNIFHFTLGIFLMSGQLKLMEFVRTPVIIAMFLGLLVNLSGLELSTAVIRPLDMIGQAAIPMMLLSLGVRLQHVQWNDLSMALAGCILGPSIGVLIALLMSVVLNMDADQAKQILIFGALPPAVMNFIFAERYNLEPEKVASLVLMSNMMSIGVYAVVLYFVV